MREELQQDIRLVGEGTVRYDAFISYRHKEPDTAAAIAIQRKLETYRIPRYIKKKSGLKKIGRVFRDQDELPLLADLGEGIVKALDASEWLIVVCTPDLPQSRWCLAEIDHFINTGRRDRILTVLAAGEPEQSFPEQLRFEQMPDGALVEREPLAADIRGDSVARIKKKIKNEKLRLLAPMLGVGYDDLRRRQRERVMRLTVGVSLAAVAFFAAFGGFSLWQNTLLQRQMEETERQRGIAEVQRNTAQRSQSLFLADLSQQQLLRNNPVHAALLALEALPENLQDPERPFVMEAEYALRKTENYLSTTRLSQVLSFDYEGRIQGLHSGSTGRYVLIDASERRVCLFDAHTGEMVADFNLLEINGDILFPDNDPKSYYLVDSDSKILFRSYMGLQSFDTKTGKLLAEAPITNDQFRSSAVFEDEDGGYIVLDDYKGWFFVYDFDLNLLFSAKPPEEVGTMSKVVRLAAGKHLLATGYVTGQVRLWDPKTGKMLAEHYENEVVLSSLKYYRGVEGRPGYFLSLSSGVICFINAKNGEMEDLLFAGEEDEFKQAAYNPFLDEFSIYYADGTLSTYDFGTRSPTSSIRSELREMEYSPDGSTLLVYLYGEVTSFSLTATLEGWKSGELVFSLDNIMMTERFDKAKGDHANDLIYVLRDNKLVAYQTTSGMNASFIQPATDGSDGRDVAFYYCFSPDSSLFMAVYGKALIGVYETETSELLYTLRHAEISYTNLEGGFSDDNRYLWISSLDSKPVVFDLTTSLETPPPWTDLSIDFRGLVSPDGRRYILSRERDTGQKAYTAEFDLVSGEELHRVDFNISRRGWYSPDGMQVVLGDQNRFYVLDAGDWSIQHQLVGAWNEFLNMNFHWVNIKSMRALELTEWRNKDTGEGNRISVVDLAAGERLWEQSLSGIKVVDAALSADAGLVAVLHSTRRVRVYDVDTGELRYDVALPADVSEMIFGPSDHTLLVNRGDIALELWDLEEEKPFAYYDAGISIRIVKRCGFSPDGSLFVLRGRFGDELQLRRNNDLETVVWRIEQWLDGRRLSERERKEYFLAE